MDKDVPAPSVLDRLSHVPLALFGVFDGIEDADMVAPRQLCNNLLHKFAVWAGLRKNPYEAEIPCFKSSNFLEGLTQICGKPV